MRKEGLLDLTPTNKEDLAENRKVEGNLGDNDHTIIRVQYHDGREGGDHQNKATGLQKSRH